MNIDWIQVLDWLKTVAAIIIGGLITLGVNLVVQIRERQARYAIQNRHEIYDPIYDEVVQKLEKLADFRNPFNARASLQSWLQLKPSARLRVPDELESLIEDLKKTVRRFNERHWRVTLLLHGHIDETIAEIQDHLDERVWSGSNVEIRKRQIFESYGGDLLAGKILPIRHSLDLSGILSVKPGSDVGPETIFHMICERMATEVELRAWEEARASVLDSMQRLQQWLEVRIETILTTYESKLTRL